MAPFPSSNRRVVVNPVNSAGPFPLDFPLFAGDGSDLDVRLNDIPVLDFTLTATIQSGFYGAPNTWVNGSVNLPEPVTGELVIMGRRAPRRQGQYAEGRGVPARDINTELNALTAVDQELRRDLSKALEPIEGLPEAVAAAQAAAGVSVGAAETATVAAEAADDAKEAAEAVAASMGDVLRYSVQSLTDPQIQQALTNLGSNANSRDIFKNASTLGATMAKIADAAAGRVAINAAPLPQIATGVGQMVRPDSASGVAFTLPAGGTWYWWRFGASASAGTINSLPTDGIAAGGTTVAAGAGDTRQIGWAQRIT